MGFFLASGIFVSYCNPMTNSPPPFELDNFLPYHLAVASGKLSQSLSCIYRHYDIDRAMWRILVYLGNKAQTVQSRTIRELAQLDKVQFARAAEKLEQKKWIVRHTNPHDQRHKDITLTPQGRDIYEKIIAKVSQWNEKMIQDLGEDTVQAMIKGAKSIQNKL